jgi:hypothetical protein
VIDDLKKLGLSDRYIQAKMKVLTGYWATDFKLREPKHRRIRSFRISQKYRAFGILDDNKVLRIFEINDHQD